MNDDDPIQRMRDQLKALAQQIADTVWPAIQRLVDTVRSLLTDTAKARWREAQQTARMLSRHPDLAALDRHLDHWYLDPVWAT